MQSMDYMEVSNLCNNSASGMDETLFIKMMTTGKDISVKDQWEGEDGFMSSKEERERVVKERWDDTEELGNDTCPNTKTEVQAVKKENVKKQKEQMIVETTQRDLKSVLNVEKGKKKRGKIQKSNHVNNRNETDNENSVEREKLEEMRKIALFRHGVKRKRKRRPFVKKKGDKMEEQLLPDGNSPEPDTETVVDIRKMEKQSTKCTELEIEPGSSKDDVGDCRKMNTMDGNKIGFNTRENKTTVDDDEDDEDDDDGFVPRKLFLFSFTHFKDEELQNKETCVY